MTEPAASARSATAGRSALLRARAARLAQALGGALLVLWGAATLAFVALKAVPGDPVDTMLGPLSSVGPEERAAIRRHWGLELPLWQQYLLALWRPLSGDFGVSYQQQRPVLALLGEQLPATLALAGAAMLLALALALGFAALTRRGPLRAVAAVLEPVAVAAPTFWVALTLAAVLGYGLRWLPVTGGDPLARLVLPAIALALPIAGVLGQLLRQGLDAAERQPFAESARARGLGRIAVVWRHTLRHAAVGALGLAGTLFGWLLGGTVLVETVFSRPGVGRVALDAILGRDLPVVMAVVILAGAVFVLLNAAVDALAAVLDPRLRPASRGAEAPAQGAER